MSEKEVLEEKIKEKKDNEMKEYVDKMLSQSMQEQQQRLFEAHQKHEAEEHSHATHSSEAFCPGCGDKNPDFKEKQLVCENCDNPVGTEEEITSGKVKVCRHCGHDKAKEKK